MMREKAPAKLNLALHVLGRRPDGYHDLETLFAFCRDGDVLEVAEAAEWSLRLAGPFAAGLDADAQNLVARAMRAFDHRFGTGTGYRVLLEKNLPVASGIGGGSADAAAMLRALAMLNGVALDDRSLVACAADLGADVPACLLGRTAIGHGVGDRLVPVAPMTGVPILLVNPGVPLATSEVFAAWGGRVSDGIAIAEPDRLVESGRNDLTEAAVAIAPEIADVLRLLSGLEGVRAARMSGSGATCFGAFRTVADRMAGARAIAAARPQWWRLETELA